MITLNKQPGKDFVILNLTDVQLGNDEWLGRNGKIASGTIRELVEREHPDLITVSGDIAWADHRQAYRNFADRMEKTAVPWAPVWGNHDHQGGAANVNEIAEEYMAREHCVYEKGDPALGNGNYVIAVKEGEKIVEGLIMMDSHDSAEFTDANGETKSCWANLLPEQIAWYRNQVKMLKNAGCAESMTVMHIPVYAYNDAYRAAYDGTTDPKSVEPRDRKGWKSGFEGAFGVKYEDICSYPEDEGFFDAVLEENHTKIIVSGHDHINSFAIPYQGVWFIYALKTGAGCYWDQRLSGGTVFKISSEGVSEFYHVYVDPDQFE